MDLLWQELSAIPYIILGIILLFVIMFISDVFTKSADKIYKKEDEHESP
jgi:uncharacterized membrane protein YuzA (DUF378 family)